MKPYLKFASTLLLSVFMLTTACDDSENPIIVQPQNQLVAVAGEDKSIFLNEELVLDGSASFDRNSKAFTYSWSIKSKPQGSTASLLVSTIAKPTFKADISGLYVIELEIKQDTWTAKDEVNVLVSDAIPNEPVAIILSSNIDTPITLQNIFTNPNQIDYIVTENIQVRAGLTIMPGVRIAFQQHKGLEIMAGFISAKGNNDSPIVFTGMEDQASYWKGITIYSNSEANEFDFVTVQHAGSLALDETGVRSNLLLSGNDFSGAALTANHSTFSTSGGYGLYVQGASMLYGQQQNVFHNNQQAAAFISVSSLHHIDPTSFSAINVLETGGTLLHGAEIVWKKLNATSYLVTQDLHLKTGVHIEPGASFKLGIAVGITITDNGYLNATGTAAEPILFNSTGSQHYWDGLYFNSYSQENKLVYTDVSNAGHTKMGELQYRANIAVGAHGLVNVEHSTIRNCVGYGLVAQTTAGYNENFATANTFSNLFAGIVFPAVVEVPETMSGKWFDYWTLTQGLSSVADNFYHPESGVWFNGAANPWAMNPKGFGITFTDDGRFVWTIAERSPMNGCDSYSAEYITGTYEVSADAITFNQEYWRSKFTNSCDASQEVDTEVTPSIIPISYQVAKVDDFITNTHVWKLTFINPDGSYFFYYKRID